VSPAEFIPVAERNGTIVQIGAWVLRQACRQMVHWQHTHGTSAPAHLAVNVSARQLREPSFAQTVADVLAETGLDPHHLLIEITETAVFDGGLAVDTVQAVQALGVKIALDDFGTGHSSLGLLRTCPVDVLKVDKTFVDEVTGTIGQAAIATSIAQIAHALNLTTVAEG
ncbi:EAL domain-containing protein, partial [Spirillospora albida]|uniref:EAL domain-containing protein n=1 Tax=Spirillospora albida TaxID=58123 RepID=UPI0004C143EC